ncbi:hypothetical protein [Haloglomus litoreum]|uniref:hypothetical protein n=1 Tax=Haloglomus litoreum TaxID=3034026 RepID=UPI0023E89D41|nr:hypothetical protein [Haloglomus sp. DT116]
MTDTPGDPTATDPPVRPPLPTLGVVSGRAFLALGAVVGALGWGVTSLLTARPGLAGATDPALLAALVWAPLVVLMVGGGVFATPDAVRFARPFLVWGPVNAAASMATLGALLGWLPAATYWVAWALAGAAGFLATGAAVRRTGDDGALWLATAACEAGVVVAGLVLGGPWPFAVLGVLHAVPLALWASGLARRLGAGVALVPVLSTAAVLGTGLYLA